MGEHAATSARVFLSHPYVRINTTTKGHDMTARDTTDQAMLETLRERNRQLEQIIVELRAELMNVNQQLRARYR